MGICVGRGGELVGGVTPVYARLFGLHRQRALDAPLLVREGAGGLHLAVSLRLLSGVSTVRWHKP